LNGGVYFGISYLQKIGFRLEGTLGSVTASDARATKRDLKRRNLNFTSSITELSLLAELHPLNLFSRQDNTPALSPYLLAGIGYFGFDPRTQFNGQWIYLQPLHTEGEGFPETGRPNYKLSDLNIPVGGGLQYDISDKLVLRGEIIYRVLNTDYLDDVSTTYIDPNLFNKYLAAGDAALARQLADRGYEIPGGIAHRPGGTRGNPKNHDALYSINIKLGIRLGSAYGSFYNSGSKKRNGCNMQRAL
jgi:opacity protein-like surface antigen